MKPISTMTPFLFRMDDFLQISLIIEVRAVGRVVTCSAFLLFGILQFFARVRMAFCGTMTGFTLDIFIIYGRLPVRSKPRCVAGEAEGIRGLILLDQSLVGPGVRGGRPVLLFAGMTGFAALVSQEGKKLGNFRDRIGGTFDFGTDR